jgi:hypothetical protein
MIMQPSPASVADQKTPNHWLKLSKSCEDCRVLKLWKTGNGPVWPQIAILQLSDKLLAELHQDPLAFYDKYGIFDPKSDHDQGHAVFRLLDYKDAKAAAKDPTFVVAMHDRSTYSAFAAFEVGDVTP